MDFSHTYMNLSHRKIIFSHTVTLIFIISGTKNNISVTVTNYKTLILVRLKLMLVPLISFLVILIHVFNLAV